MTRYAERHQIIRVMRAAVSNLLDVVHECRANISALLLAPLAERMECYVPIANPAPRAAISFVLIVPACEAVIMPLHRLLMNVTIAAFSVCEIRTARHTAGPFRLPRHLHRLPSYRFHHAPQNLSNSLLIFIRIGCYTNKPRASSMRRFAISQYSCIHSMPMALRPMFFAATSVEPLPANGSSTVPLTGTT